jgi:hypothetical protein
MTKRREGVTPDQSKFIDWLIEPPQTRLPKTQKEYAEENNCSDRTLTKWKKDMKFREAWDRALFDLNVSPDRVQSVIDAMWAQSCRGNVKAAELYLKYTDRYRPSIDVIHSESSVEELSDDELEVEYQGFLAREVERRQAEEVAARGDDDE